MLRTPSSSFAPKQRGRNDVRAQRQAYEQVDQQVDERTVGADSGQRRAARKASHDDDIGCVEQQLQDAGCSQRQGKQDDLLAAWGRWSNRLSGYSVP